MTTLETPTSLRAALSLTLPQTPPPQVINNCARDDAVISPAQAVQATARAISRNTLHPVAAATAGVAFHPRSLLAALLIVTPLTSTDPQTSRI